MNSFMLTNNFYYFLNTNAQVIVTFLAIMVASAVFVFSLIELDIRYIVSRTIVTSKTFIIFFLASILATLLSLSSILLIKASGINSDQIEPHFVFILMFFSVIVFDLVAIVCFVGFLIKSIPIMSSKGQVQILLQLMDKKYFNQYLQEKISSSTKMLAKSNGGSVAVDSRKYLKIHLNDPLHSLETIVKRKAKNGDTIEASVFLEMFVEHIYEILPQINHAHNFAGNFCDLVSRLSSPIAIVGDSCASIRTIQIIKRLFAWGSENKFKLLTSNIGNAIRDDLRTTIPFYKSNILIRDYTDEMTNLARLHLSAANFINSIFASYWLGSIVNAIQNKKFVYASLALEQYFRSLDDLILFGEESSITIADENKKTFITSNFFKYCFLEIKRSQIVSPAVGQYKAWVWALLAYRHFCNTLVNKNINSCFYTFYDEIICENALDIPPQLKDTLLQTHQFTKSK